MRQLMVLILVNILCGTLFGQIGDTAKIDSAYRGISVQMVQTDPPVGCSVTGTANVTAGKKYTYKLTCTNTDVRWNTLNGDLFFADDDSATVIWNNQSSGTIAGKIGAYLNGVLIAEKSVQIIHALPTIFLPGSISPSEQLIDSNTVAADLTCTAAILGDGTTFHYQWQQSEDSVEWEDIAGTTALTFSPGVLQTKTFFRVNVTQGILTASSDVAVIGIAPPLGAGVSSPSFQTILYNTVPETITCTAASGGMGSSYSYQWQRSVDNNSWSNISGANSLSYMPQNLTTTTYYRLKVLCSAVVVYGRSVMVNVLPSGVPLPVATVPPGMSLTENYIANWAAVAPTMDPYILVSRPLTDVNLSIQYFDGLGKPVQTILKQGSLISATGVSSDLVTTMLYDSSGRNNSTLLPYAAGAFADGHYRSNGEAEQKSWYEGVDSPVADQEEPGLNARTLTVFEKSPLGRVMEVFAPGKSWLGTNSTGATSSHHSIKQQYRTNTATDNVKYWTITFGGTVGTWSSYSSPRTYAAGTLYKDVTVDEQNRQVITFKDKDGHLLLKKVQLSATDLGTGSGHAGWLCTYYLYDDLDNLRCVIQPEGVKLLEANSWSFTNTVGKNLLKDQCFRYEYDGRNRMVIKQVPGAGPVYMVYDTRDRLVMTQDSLMRTAHNWLTTHYDNLNRADTTWLYNTTGSFASILAAAADTTKYPYTNPTAAAILTETHYDDYLKIPSGLTTTYKTDWNGYFSATSSTTFPYPEMPAQNQAITTKGLVTWARVKVLDSTLQLASVNIYDDKSRLIQTQRQNITGGVDVTTTQYSWAGWPLVTVQKQDEKVGTATQTSVVVTKMTYDDLGRLVKTEMKQSNSKVDHGTMQANYAILSEVGYDALGQVKQKKIGKRRSSTSSYTTTPLETQDYDYNIRGWLLGVNRAYVRSKTGTDSSATATTTQTLSGEMFTESSMDVQTVTFPSTNYFGFDLGYDQRNNNRINGILYDSARYDGNITGMTWKGAYDRKIRKYDFGYDPVNRLTGAKFGQLVGSGFSTTPVNYNVSNLTYDGNGNILTMNQYGLKTATSSAIIDQLSYHYISGSNRLLNVVDAANDPNSLLGDFKYTPVTKTATTADYTYDGNGNMISDQNKKITGITYNILNLPGVITVAGKGTIRYYYDAAGNKLRKRTLDNTISPSRTTVTTYIGGAVYQNDTLQFFGTPEGRMRSNTDSSGWVYDYFLKDHLGNTRMMITDDYNVASPILEANSYYPFGLQQKEVGLRASELLHNYKNTFQKQELNEDLGVDMYEFKYRMDDPQIGRFWQVDPLADKYEYNSTYAFSENKLTGGIELEGTEYLKTIDKFGYTGTWMDIPSAIDNGGINLLNSAISLYNSGVSTVASISNGTYGKDLGNGFKAIGNSIYDGSANTINYTINTPIKQQISEVGRALISPESLEFASGLALGGALGKVAGGASNIGNFSLKGISTEAATSDAEVNSFTLRAAKGGTSVLSAGDALRIENAATRIDKPITVVGSRAKGTAGAFSDWDYVIEGLNNKGWKQIKNSLPGSKSVLDNTPRNIDIFKTLDPTKPHITIYPR